MRVIKSHGDVKVTVVCCLHGDEIFGERVFRYYKERLLQTSGLRLVLAHEEAFHAGVRYIDADLNRSFPGNPEGNQEERLASELLDLVSDSQYVVDIHTTTSRLKMTPIVANMSSEVKTILNLCDSQEVAYMSKQIAKCSLIGNVLAGVSLEFEKDYAATDEALREACLIVDRLVAGLTLPKRNRKVYFIDTVIGTSIALPQGSRNFCYVQQLGFYPFLLGERSYRDFQGFAATKLVDMPL